MSSKTGNFVKGTLRCRLQGGRNGIDGERPSPVLRVFFFCFFGFWLVFFLFCFFFTPHHKNPPPHPPPKEEREVPGRVSSAVEPQPDQRRPRGGGRQRTSGSGESRNRNLLAATHPGRKDPEKDIRKEWHTGPPKTTESLSRGGWIIRNTTKKRKTPRHSCGGRESRVITGERRTANNSKKIRYHRGWEEVVLDR